MAKKKNKGLLFVFALVGLFAVIIGFGQLFSISQGQTFSVTGEDYYLPVFGNVACEKTDRPTVDLIFEPYTTTSGVFFVDEVFEIDIGNANGDFIKTVDELNIFCSAEYDNVYTNGCDIEIKRTKSELSSLEYLCPATYNNIDACSDITLGSITNNVWTKVATISRDESIAVREFSNNEVLSDAIVKGELIYRSSRDEYGLISLTDGRKEKFNSCDLRDISRTTDVLNDDIIKGKNEGKIVGNTLMFGQTINYITSFVAMSDSSRLIEDNNYYSYGAGIKYPIEETQFGRNMVDLSSPITDASIICDPAQLFCTNDGTNIDVQFGVEGECDFEGEITSWIPSSEKDNFVEIRECVNSEWNVIESKAIPTCSESEIINQDYTCVKGTVRDVEDVSADSSDVSYTGLITLLIGIFIIVIVTVISRRKK